MNAGLEEASGNVPWLRYSFHLLGSPYLLVTVVVQALQLVKQKRFRQTPHSRGIHHPVGKSFTELDTFNTS
jgi:hypothetical protein